MTSFFMSIMYPTIFAIGIRDMGEETNLAGSMIVMAILGGAILTPVMGLISEYSHSMAAAYLVPAVCYLVIAAFSSQTPTAETSA
jgi:MFS transporter, FHS family, L-fucose permease